MAKKSHKSGDPIIIKKYANRRLYNTATSSYVTLDHLAELVKSDTDFVVRDAKTGEDITHNVLTQIIFEKESKAENMLPLPFLRQLISLYGDGLQAMVPGYLQSAMEALKQNQDEVRNAFMQGKGADTYVSLFEDITKRNMAMFQETMSMFSAPQSAVRPKPAPKETPEEPTDTPASTASQDDEIEALQAQLAALKDKVDALSK
ncbi:polyhydroxyalkanoate synthesis repressor PhaR [Kordiimonas sediminis]|uniref:Polyhydroxyalkanoate synthesis repressor PhaR n=1 Tax=Kordiimonas sediminis TaxID=1735581 RepID=A0A919E449_9PROT|nr:polyhydroxyalkanoate synthesis repressor PhaR [Kordiimonas sediminis]GHF11808.1 polyhydroxyalkanoate synthesis repressor PhaR [Kordiimonas sediminis]